MVHVLVDALFATVAMQQHEQIYTNMTIVVSPSSLGPSFTCPMACILTDQNVQDLA